MATTKAFKLYVNDKFIDKFYPYLHPSFSLKGDSAEKDLISAMCHYYCDKINDKFDFYQMKADYKQKMRHLSPNKDSVAVNKYIEREQTGFRIKYNTDLILNGEYGIETLACLYIIYTKLNKASSKRVKDSCVYKYLLFAYADITGLNLSPMLRCSLTDIAKELQGYVVVENLEQDSECYKGEISPEGKLITYEFINGKDEPMTHNLTPEEIAEYRNFDDLEQALFVAEKLFQQNLRQEINTLENGIIF